MISSIGSIDIGCELASIPLSNWKRIAIGLQIFHFVTSGDIVGSGIGEGKKPLHSLVILVNGTIQHPSMTGIHTKQNINKMNRNEHDHHMGHGFGYHDMGHPVFFFKEIPPA